MEADRRQAMPLTRTRQGRWLGGVCAGLAAVRDVKVVWIRLAFAAAAFVGGLGVLIYLACWLIIPEADRDPSDTPGGIVLLAQAGAACAGLLALGAIGVVSTVFGFGWVVLGLAAAFLIGVLALWPRLGPAWALLPIASMALPAIAVAAQGWRLAPSSGHVVVAPKSLDPSSRPTYREGLGTTLLDLRHTTLPARGTGGDAYFSPRLAAFVLQAFSASAERDRDTDLEALTPREREVLHHLARGYAYKQIGVRLGISARTVESHVSAVLRKLQLTSRHEVTHWAASRGLIETQ